MKYNGSIDMKKNNVYYIVSCLTIYKGGTKNAV